MKRLLAVLIVILGLTLGLNVARAEGVHLGVRLGLPFLIGVQAGYDFGSNGSGFGVRAVAEASFVGTAGIFNIAADVYHRFQVSYDGSNAYLGVGAGLLGAGAFGGGSGSALDIHLLVGFEFVFSSQFGLFVEVTPFHMIAAPGSNVQLLTLPFVSAGGVFRF